MIIAILIFQSTSKDQQDALDKEYELYGDVVQTNMADTYEGLTYKMVGIFEWIRSFCYHVSFVVKADDDMYLNMHELNILIDSHVNDSKTIYGRHFPHAQVLRDIHSKWYVSNETYSLSAYPAYMQGASYMFTGDIIDDVFYTAIAMDFFDIEDIFITGFVREVLNISLAGVDNFLEFIGKDFDNCDKKHVITTHGTYDLRMYEMYTLDMNEELYKC